MNLVGRTLGKYELEEWVGAGATADVYLSHHPRLGIEVAVKVLKPQPDLGDDDVDRFVREAKDLIRLKHGSIVRLHDIGRDDGFTFLVLEFLHGRVLRDELDAEGPLAIDRVADIVARAADALDYLHDHDRVHLDIKPSNIVLGVDDEVTITDFGLAQCLGGAQNEPTVVSGTAPYMSPEQARGERDLGRESDVYSLGAVAYEMIVGRPPHTGDTPEDVLSKVAADAPATPIRDVNSGVPIPVASVVMRALECRKGNRFGTAGDFAADLTLAARAVALDRTIDGAPVPTSPNRPVRVFRTACRRISPTMTWCSRTTGAAAGSQSAQSCWRCLRSWPGRCTEVRGPSVRRRARMPPAAKRLAARRRPWQPARPQQPRYPHQPVPRHRPTH